jgi:hypothetical protein
VQEGKQEKREEMEQPGGEGVMVMRAPRAAARLVDEKAGSEVARGHLGAPSDESAGSW